MSTPNGHQPAGTAGETETDQKLQLIDYSYKEVLDATKHQDDKIGQLLTSISFLTAATLALAALESGSFITRSFNVDPFKVPLALIALIVFLIGVAWSVMLLLTSLSTPLRIPGIARPRRDKPVNWVKGVGASQIYFYEISRVSLDQWEEKWSASVEDLKRERLRSLIRETHNLGVRTRAKYDRTSEAVALLSMALLAFALSVVLVAIVAGTPSSVHAVILNWWQRLIVGWVFGCYAWLQALSQIRYNRQAVDESPPRGEKSGDRVKSRAEIWYAITIGLIMIDVIIYDKSWHGLGEWGLSLWIVVTVLLVLILLGAFLFTSTKQSYRVQEILPAVQKMLKEIRVRRRQDWLSDYWGRWLLVGVIVALAMAVIWCGVDGLYAGNLAAVGSIVLLIIGNACAQPSIIAARQRAAYWEGVQAAQAALTAGQASTSQPSNP